MQKVLLIGSLGRDREVKYRECSAFAEAPFGFAKTWYSLST
jgi:hypothetical protein